VDGHWISKNRYRSAINLEFIRFFVFCFTKVFYYYSQDWHGVHCTENPIYVFPEMNLRCHVPNSYSHVSVSDLYIPRIGQPIWLQQNRQIHECGKWETEHYNSVLEITRPHSIEEGRAASKSPY
jgi:hypothetical protein